jgi:hypothetical protein
MSESLSVLARDHCLAPGRVDAPRSGGRYRSLFDDLPPLAVDERALHELGRPGGPCDLGVDGTDRADSDVAAVWPFFGQFIAHDITADRSPLVHRAVRAELRNARAPRANLEGLYGAGPVGAPYLYRRDDPAKLLLPPGGSDVPRNHEGIALIGDPREADVLHDGDRLGPVGGRIVGETLVGIVDADPESFRSVDPGWLPTLQARRAGAFGLADILAPAD